MTFAQDIAAQFEIETNWKKDAHRTAPVRGAWPNNPKFISGGIFCDRYTGKKYAVEIIHTRDDELSVRVWHKGREMPEKHRVDIRQVARNAYCEAFDVSPVILLGQGRTVYRPARVAAVIEAGRVARMVQGNEVSL